MSIMAYKMEELDMERYLNFDGNFKSPAKAKTIVPPVYQQPEIQKINTYAPLTQTFAGPSHQYDLHPQHIPLPPGALANSLAIPPLQYGYQNYMECNAVYGEDYGFSQRGSIDMEMDESLYNDCIDPNMVYEEDSPVLAPVEVVRVYPGIHASQAQQAALAKQQQQMEIQKQQQIKKPSHKPSGSKGKIVDPVVEERISKLLNQMRQTVNSPTQSQESTPPATTRTKKEEDEMDEDERLLASEEGKKLSSKERRQLRNKVSARAFRSRRKEYIGQLESEVADKTSESDQLRAENEALKAENVRLTDLTKLLLSSTAFSTFLNDLSSKGLPASIVAPPAETPKPKPEQPVIQDPTPPIIEEDIDFNSLDANSNWNSGMDFSFGTGPQVYTVDIPESFVDTTILSGKSSEPILSEKEIIPKVDAAAAAPPTEKIEYIPDETVEFDESDPAFALFTDTSATITKPVYDFFGSIAFEKATETFDLTIETGTSEVSDVTLARFERLCLSFDSLASRWQGIME